MALPNQREKQPKFPILRIGISLCLTILTLSSFAIISFPTEPTNILIIISAIAIINFMAWFLTFRSLCQWKKYLDKSLKLKSQYQNELDYIYELLYFHINKLNKEILARQEMEDREKVLNEKLMLAARRAGMSDIATSMLHNIGNVLNSLNVSISFLKEKTNKDDLNNLMKVIKMLEDNLAVLPHYLTHDQKGKLIPNYLIAISKQILDSYELMDCEISNMRKSVHHIKHIVSMQDVIGGSKEMISSISLSTTVELAIEMCGNILLQGDIQLVKEFQNIEIMTDKNKLLQILVNLLQNAKDAVLMNERSDVKTILIKIEKMPDSFVHVSIKDNGVGIDVDQFIKLFSMGFTTKVSGHGFGLHSSATIARELGGRLEVYSDGKFKGSTFILSLPLMMPSKLQVSNLEKTPEISNPL